MTERPWNVCTVEGCSSKARTRFGILCEKHYYRRRRRGNVDEPVRGKVTVSSAGYLLAYLPTHPIATKSGMVYQHRAVLFDKIGDGDHACRWCGKPVSWRKRGANQLYVDHLDTVKTNNSPENLVPACAGCNAGRAFFVHWIAKHADDPYLIALFERASGSAS